MIKYIYPTTQTSQHSKLMQTFLRKWVKAKHRRGARSILQRQITYQFRNNSDLYRRMSPLWTPNHPLWLLSDVIELLEKWFSLKYKDRVEIRVEEDDYGCRTILKIIVHFPELCITDPNNNVYISKDVFTILTIPFADCMPSENYVIVKLAIKKLSWTYAERREGYISSHVSPTSSNTGDNLCWGGNQPESTIYTSEHPTAITFAAKIFQYMLMLETLLSTEYSNSESGHRPFKSFATVITKHLPISQRDVYLNYLLPRYTANESLIKQDFTMTLQDLGYPYVKARLKSEVLAQLVEDQTNYYRIDNQYFKSTQSVKKPSLKDETFRFKGEYWESRFVDPLTDSQHEAKKAIPPAEVKLLESIISKHLTKQYYETFINGNHTYTLAWSNPVDSANIPEATTEDSLCEPISEVG